MPGMEYAGHMGHTMPLTIGTPNNAPFNVLVSTAYLLRLADPVEVMPAMRPGKTWALALYLPEMAASLILVLLVEKFVLSRIPSVSRWLGLVPA